MRARGLATVGLLALLWWPALAAERPPQWLAEVATREIPEYDRDVDSVVLFDEEVARVDSSGKVTTTRRRAVKVLQRGGREEALASVVYTTDVGRVRQLEAWLIYPSGEHRAFGKKETLEAALSANDVYNEARMQLISAADQADPGAVFGYESVLEERSIFSQFLFSFQRAAPALTSRFTLSLPTGWRAEATTLNGPQMEAFVQGSSYTWELKNLPPIEREVASPGISALAPRVAVTYFPPDSAGAASPSFAEWGEVATWLARLNAPQVEPDAAVREQAAQLTAGAASEWDKLRAIGEFAQGIKYVSIQTGVGRGGGYTPHAAPEVLQNLYGDCKDKANLMRSLLQAVGIRSYPVAIYSGDPRFVREEWASPQQFNHAIVAIEVGDDAEAPAIGEWEGLGRLLLFDPTDPYTPLGLLPEQEQDSWALVAASENGQLIRAPAVEPEQNRVVREASVTLSAAGSIEATLKENSVGQAATEERSLHRRATASEYRNAIERWITRGAPGAALANLEVSDDPDSAFTLDVAFSAPGYAQSIAGQLLVFKPAIVERRYGTYLTDGVRVHPVLLAANAFQETIRFALPEGFAVDEQPTDVELHAPFGDYTATWAALDGELVFARQLTVRSAEVAPEEYDVVRDFFRAIVAAEQSPVVLAKR